MSACWNCSVYRDYKVDRFHGGIAVVLVCLLFSVSAYHCFGFFWASFLHVCFMVTDTGIMVWRMIITLQGDLDRFLGLVLLMMREMTGGTRGLQVHGRMVVVLVMKGTMLLEGQGVLGIMVVVHQGLVRDPMGKVPQGFLFWLNKK